MTSLLEIFFLISLIWASTIVTVAENKEKHSRSTIWLILVKDFWNNLFKSWKQQKFCLNSLFSLSLKNKSPICAYFVSLYRVCGFAKCLWLKLVKLLLPLVHDYPLLVDPRSLCDTAKELDVIFPVTCTAAEERKQVAALLCLHIYTLKLEQQRRLRDFTSGVDASVDLHLWVWGHHAGPPGVGTHLGPHQISYYKLLTEACLLDHWWMMDLRNLNMNKSLLCFQNVYYKPQQLICDDFKLLWWVNMSSCLRCLWFGFNNGLRRLLCLHRRCFFWRRLDVGVLCLACGTWLCLARVQALFLSLQQQSCTLFPLLLLPLMSALRLSGLVLLRLFLKTGK